MKLIKGKVYGYKGIIAANRRGPAIPVERRLIYLGNERRGKYREIFQIIGSTQLLIPTKDIDECLFEIEEGNNGEDI